MFPCLEPCFEPWGHTPHQNYPPYPSCPPFLNASPTVGPQTSVGNEAGCHWHFDALIPTGLKAEALHSQGPYPRSSSPGDLPLLSRSPKRVSFISQPYEGQHTSLLDAEFEIINKRVAIGKRIVDRQVRQVRGVNKHRGGRAAMSEPKTPHASCPVPRPQRAERITTSCGECRRRKQKCNQGQPCSNCARRYPQPLCEYKPSSRRLSAVAAGVKRPSFSISVVPPPPEPLGTKLDASGASRAPFPPRQPSPLSASPSPWPRTPGEEVSGPLGAWPGFDTVGQSPISPSSREYAWSTDPNLFLSHLLSCQENCKQHSAQVHDIARTLASYHTATSPWGDGGGGRGGGGWGLETNPLVMNYQGISSTGGDAGVPWGPAPPPISPELGHIPVPPRRLQDGELFTVYINLISQFKASLDGNPDASNPYLKYYVPYCIQSALLQRIGIYTAACFLSDTGHFDRTMAMAYKGQAIELLNKHLHSQLSTSDEGIAGVVQLIVDEWHWGNPNDLHAHLRGLREMIKIRGGFRTLGLHGLISKLAITADVAIALSFEGTPYLKGGPEFEFPDTSRIPLRLSLNTPFMSNLASFASCDEALRIHEAVASILDDMRFLLNAVLTLPATPSEKQLQKLRTTSGWIHERILSLPADGPTTTTPTTATNSSIPPLTATAPAAAPAAPPPLSPSSASPSRAIKPEPSDDYNAAISMSRGRSVALRHLQQQQQPITPRRHSSSSPDPNSAAAASSADYIYQSVRLAALLYSRAILLRKPFSQVVTAQEFVQLWTTTWKVSLNTWRGLLGVFNWILVPLVSVSGLYGHGHGHGHAQTASGSDTDGRHGRFVKGLTNVSLIQIGMENWEICKGVMEGAAGLQRWLKGEDDQDRDRDWDRCGEEIEDDDEGETRAQKRREIGFSSGRRDEGSVIESGGERERARGKAKGKKGKNVIGSDGGGN